LPLLKSYYGTGGDLFVDEIHEVIPITASMGLLHPQEGVVNGHFGSEGKERTERLQKLQQGVSMTVSDPDFVPSGSSYTVADLITGYGVAESVIYFYQLQGESVKGKRVLVQGWGNVGAAAGYYLSQAGARITGILDKTAGIIRPEGFSHEDTTRIFNSRMQSLFDGFESTPDADELFWKQPAEIFIPAAASRLVSSLQLQSLIGNGLEVTGCGANVPFADQEIFFGPISRMADEQTTLIPDFISNCGMARVFAFLMGNPDDLTATSIFMDVKTTIRTALDRVHALNGGKTGITATAYEIALKELT